MLSDKQILQGIKDGLIVIDFFDENNLGANSYDVTLGEHYWVMKTPNVWSRYIDLRSNKITMRSNIYSDGDKDIKDAYVYKNALEENNIKMYGDPVVIIPTHQFVLCHTQEVVGTVDSGAIGIGDIKEPKNIVAIFENRSTMARLGLVTHIAGFGDVGFVSKWTLEFYNFSPFDIILPVGYKVGQFQFDHTGAVRKAYSGRYSVKDWNPEDMLPRLFAG